MMHDPVSSSEAVFLGSTPYSLLISFAIGAAITLNTVDGVASNELLSTGFGIVAMVAMTPLITIQLLGFKSVVQRKVVEKHRLKTIISSEDEQIINFM